MVNKQKEKTTWDQNQIEVRLLEDYHIFPFFVNERAEIVCNQCGLSFDYFLFHLTAKKGGLKP